MFCAARLLGRLGHRTASQLRLEPAGSDALTYRRHASVGPADMRGLSAIQVRSSMCVCYVNCSQSCSTIQTDRAATHGSEHRCLERASAVVQPVRPFQKALYRFLITPAVSTAQHQPPLYCMHTASGCQPARMHRNVCAYHFTDAGSHVRCAAPSCCSV